jgi:PAS domain S-box-containing protein
MPSAVLHGYGTDAGAPRMITAISLDVELARAKARITGLEREAIERNGEAAKELRVELERYQSLILAIAQVIWTRDPLGEMLGAQPSWAAYTGQTAAEYQHRGWLDAVHPDDRAQDLELWERAVLARAPCDYEHRLRRDDGEYRHFSVRAVPVFANDGTIREWAGIHTDITQRRLTEQSLRDGERRFRELADAMPQIVWEAGPDGHFTYYNRRWYDYTGRPHTAVNDGIWDEVVHPEDRKESLDRWNAAIASGRSYETEHRLASEGGQYRWFLARAVPVRNGERAITRWLGTCTDIDGRRQTESRLRSSLESNRDLEEFASVASHDLQEPLRKIHSFAACLKDEHSAHLDAEGLDYIDRIQRAATRMTMLIADLLQLSRLSSRAKPFARVDLNQVMTGVLSDLETRLEDTGGRVETVNLPTVLGDPLQMRQLLQNLIGNGLKFHEKDVAPVIRLSAEMVDAYSDDGQERPGGACRILVTDNGIGFEEKYLEKVLTIFQRLHGRDEYEGTGIGLAICRKIVDRHAGSITARSKPGQGATFIVTLPLFEHSKYPRNGHDQ